MAGSVRIGEMDMSETVYTCDEIKQRLQPIFAGHRIRQAVLFGSYSKGTATSQSDVDLTVICVGFNSWGLWRNCEKL